MAASIRHRLSPIAGILALTVGLTFVWGVRALASVFSTPIAVLQPVPSRENHDFYSLTRLEAPSTSSHTVFTCYDPYLLPIWHALKEDVGFKDWTIEKGDLNCSDLLDARPVDLNDDGEDEFLVRGKAAQMCSAVGNCGFWILEVTKKRARVLLSDIDFGEGSQFGEQVQSTRSGGYSTILLKYHFTAAETGYTTYRFNGKGYAESRCVFEVPKHFRDGDGSMEVISCKEFERRLQSGSANEDIRNQYRAKPVS